MSVMMQEAVLNQLDEINDVVLESEYKVLMSMCDVYMKAALIQESYAGEEIPEMFIEEGYVAADRTKYKSGAKVSDGPETEPTESTPKEAWYKRAIEWLKKTIRNILTGLKKFFGNIKTRWDKFIQKVKDNKSDAKMTAEMKKAGVRSGPEGYEIKMDYDLNAAIAAIDELTNLFRCYTNGEGNYSARETQALDKIEKSLHKTTWFNVGEFVSRKSEIDEKLSRCKKELDAFSTDKDFMDDAAVRKIMTVLNKTNQTIADANTRIDMVLKSVGL